MKYLFRTASQARGPFSRRGFVGSSFPKFLGNFHADAQKSVFHGVGIAPAVETVSTS